MNTSSQKNKRKSATARKTTVNQKNQNQANQLVLRPRSRPTVIISDCTHNYARALSNPFTGPLACVPSSPSVLSYKLKAFSKGEFSTGTSNFGFIIADPFTGIANDVAFVHHSTATYTLTSIAPLFSAQTAFAQSNSPFLNAAFGSGANANQYRVVAAGLRIRYIGTELNRGGTIIGFSDPTHSTLINQTSASMLGEVTARKLPVTKEWAILLWRPALINDYSFTTQFPNANITASIFGPMGFIVESPVGSQSAYEYEFIACYEVNGRNVRGQSMTKVDVVGQSAVASTSLGSSNFYAHATNDMNKGSSNFLDRVAHEIHTASSYVESVSNVASEVLGAGKVAYKVGSMIADLV
jgi:hypothetical protein